MARIWIHFVFWFVAFGNSTESIVLVNYKILVARYCLTAIKEFGGIGTILHLMSFSSSQVELLSELFEMLHIQSLYIPVKDSVLQKIMDMIAYYYYMYVKIQI